MAFIFDISIQIFKERVVTYFDSSLQSIDLHNHYHSTLLTCYNSIHLYNAPGNAHTELVQSKTRHCILKYIKLKLRRKKIERSIEFWNIPREYCEIFFLLWIKLSTIKQRYFNYECFSTEDLVLFYFFPREICVYTGMKI